MARQSPGAPRRPDPIDAHLAVIHDALDLAVVVAREDRAKRDAPRPPRVLVPMLDFKQIPDSALALVRSALEGDEDFRRRVAERAVGESLGEGSLLYLQRPAGWAAAIEGLVQDAEEKGLLEHLERRNEELGAALESTTARNRSLEQRESELVGELEQLRETSGEVRARIAELSEELDSARRRLGDLESDRAEAVRQLKAAEALAERRLDRQRELDAELTEARKAIGTPVRDDSAGPHEDPDGQMSGSVSGEPLREDGSKSAIDPGRLADLASAVAGFGEKLAALGEAAAGVAGELHQLLGADLFVADGRDATGRVAPAGSGDARTGAADVVPPARRASPRPGRGLSLDTPEGLREMLSNPATLLLVDGYNVSMRGWPMLAISTQRSSLLSALGSLAARGAAEIHVVFDGAEAGDRPAVGAPLPVRVHFTPAGMEADDRLLAFVEGAPAGRAVVVVSSDRRVRTGARERGAGSVSTDTLLALVRPTQAN